MELHLHCKHGCQNLLVIIAIYITRKTIQKEKATKLTVTSVNEIAQNKAAITVDYIVYPAKNLNGFSDSYRRICIVYQPENDSLPLKQMSNTIPKFYCDWQTSGVLDRQGTRRKSHFCTWLLDMKQKQNGLLLAT